MNKRNENMFGGGYSLTDKITPFCKRIQSEVSGFL